MVEIFLCFVVPCVSICKHEHFDRFRVENLEFKSLKTTRSGLADPLQRNLKAIYGKE